MLCRSHMMSNRSTMTSGQARGGPINLRTELFDFLLRRSPPLDWTGFNSLLRQAAQEVYPHQLRRNTRVSADERWQDVYAPHSPPCALVAMSAVPQPEAARNLCSMEELGASQTDMEQDDGASELDQNRKKKATDFLTSTDGSEWEVMSEIPPPCVGEVSAAEMPMPMPDRTRPDEEDKNQTVIRVDPRDVKVFKVTGVRSCNPVSHMDTDRQR